MRGITAVAVVGTLAGAAFTATAAASSNITCAKGLYILCARGSGEAVVSPNYPNNTGSPGILALKIANQINGTEIAGVVYPAQDAYNGALNITTYASSEANGTKAVMQEIVAYNVACPDGQIALIGYSQGAQIIQDALCGGIGSFGLNSYAPLPADLVNKNIVAIALIADPTHIANTTYDYGNSTRNGIFARKNTTLCNAYANKYGSWCEANDFFCDLGTTANSREIHLEEPETYGDQVVQFVVDKWTNFTETSTGTSPSGTATGTATGTGSPIASVKPNGVAGSLFRQSSQTLLVGALVVLAAVTVDGLCCGLCSLS